jgi:hypothetical protein
MSDAHETTPEDTHVILNCLIAGQKKQSSRVKWSDHFGGNLSASKIIDSESAGAEDVAVAGEDSTVSWSDRRKRDRLREKELLAKAK